MNVEIASNLLGLKEPSLLLETTDPDGGLAHVFHVYNPVNNEPIAALEDMNVEKAEQVIDTATEAFLRWKSTTVDERSSVLRKWANLMRENVEDLGRIMTIEQGKPLAESKGEINYSASFLDWYAEEVQREVGRMMPAHTTHQRLMVTHQPLGVGAIITPWNFPALMIIREVAPALAAGCTVVVKPSDLTPLSAVALKNLADLAGIPEGVFSLITTSKEGTTAIGELFTSSPKIHKLSFTGSTQTGKLLAKAGAATLTRLSLELGGNAPFIVFDDAHMENALDGLIGSKFRNAGQACVATNRIYIQDNIYDQFMEKLTSRVKSLRVGNGLDESVSIGPLISKQAVKNVEGHVADALAKGGKLITGGAKDDQGDCFFQPTIITDATHDMLPCQCEIFGPLAMVSRFSTEEEVLAKANDTIHGLAAYFYSNDRTRCWRMAEGLDAGIIGENTVAFSSARTPFGGFKQSGIGRDGGIEGLREWQEVKYRCIGGLD
ncbi:MAG: NAD-dependent succinate-semialdehyde dehydrogenase [Bacteroidota bacterium]